ncbi:37S ribosomal protein S22 [Haplosporangium sp. Z 27]|nr:37S ribosomal protein S22 [Haplosporangium sp. Z 27]
MAFLRQFQGNMNSSRTLGITDLLAHRLTGLSLASHGKASTRRGYARVARARPRTPNAPSLSSQLPSEKLPSTPSIPNKSKLDSMPEVQMKNLDSISNIKLPKNFKMAKLQTLEEYDPNMVIFLDKHGNVTMIPHDDRAKGQTRDEYNAELTTGKVEEEESSSHHQRGSKEMEYARKRIGQVEMPNNIQDAIREVLSEYDKSLIRTDALRLYGSLRSTGALDGDDILDLPTKRLKSGSEDMTAKDDKPAPAHILEYGHRESTAYIAAMAPSTYSAIKNVLEEVNSRVPNLQIKSFMDFGTGPGTGIWAANEVWKKPLQYTGIDASLAMLETAEEILDALSSKGAPIPNVTLKPFFSHGPQAAKHDVVLSAFTLSEITTPALRKSTLDHLWDSTNDVLILIDRGTPSGFKILAEAREQILGLDADRIKQKPKYDNFGNILPEEELPKREPAHVLAPCPHDKVCPIYVSLARDSQWCHFSQKVQRPDFLRKTKHSKENYEDSKYTYVVLRKGARPVFTPPPPVPTSEESLSSTQTNEPSIESTESEENTSGKKKKYKKSPPPPPVTYNNQEDMIAASHSWSRIVVPPLKNDGHVVMDTCAANGYLERIIIPRSQGKIPYRDARKAMWGDLFPHEPKNSPVRKETVKNMFNEDGTEKSPKRRPPGISAEKLVKRLKQKEKKQNRQKVSLDEIDGTTSRSRKRDKDEDIVFEL